MPLYKCECCGSRENTACGLYWSRLQSNWFDWSGIEDRKGKALCSACAPSHYADGTETGWGKWHDRFPRVPFDT